MNTKTQTTKEVLAEAKKEIFEGKSATVKDHFHTLLGKKEGIEARLAVTIARIEKELEDANAEIKKFSDMSVDEAFNEITVANQKTSSNYVYNSNGQTFTYTIN